MKKTLLFIQGLFILFLCSCAGKNGVVVLDEDSIDYPLDGMERAFKVDGPNYVDAGYIDDNYLDDHRTKLERSDSIKTYLTTIPGIERAVCLISGKTAVVGIKPSARPAAEEIIALKKTVVERIPVFDPEITQVTVTAAAKLYERIADIQTRYN